ncbi:aldo-keto reductase family 1 member A1-B isoform 3-T3 [Syngnathus typhle]
MEDDIKRIFTGGKMNEFAVLHTGRKMPLIGLGTWKSSPGQVKEVVKCALEAGYRHIDCAAVYGNEAEIGQAFAESFAQPHGVRREDVFVTSKLWNTCHHPEDVEPALQRTLRDLQLDYLDLYLIHWPMAFRRGEEAFPKAGSGSLLYDAVDYCATWGAMEQLLRKGLLRHIGLSNFNKRQLDHVLAAAHVKPAVVQVESHPYLAQTELLAHCRSLGVVMTAYSPLGSPDRAWKRPDELTLMDEPVLATLAAKYCKSPAQILLRWQTQRGVVAVPKSVTPSRIRENLQVFDFTLSEEEMTSLAALNKNWRYILPVIEQAEPTSSKVFTSTSRSAARKHSEKSALLHMNGPPLHCCPCFGSTRTGSWNLPEETRSPRPPPRVSYPDRFAAMEGALRPSPGSGIGGGGFFRKRPPPALDGE